MRFTRNHTLLFSELIGLFRGKFAVSRVTERFTRLRSGTRGIKIHGTGSAVFRAALGRSQYMRTVSSNIELRRAGDVDCWHDMLQICWTNRD